MASQQTESFANRAAMGTRMTVEQRNERLALERADQIARLEEFYKAHAPDKVGKAEQVIRGYKFVDVVASLEAKYGAAVIAKELPQFAQALVEYRASEVTSRQRREQNLVSKLEQTSKPEFAKFSAQLAEMETLMSAGGYDAIRKQFTPENKRPDYSKFPDGQLKEILEGMRGVKAKADTMTTIGAKYVDPTKDIEQIFTVPEGAKAGEKVELAMPNGKKFEFLIPEGVTAGEKIKLKVPQNGGVFADPAGQATTTVTIPENAVEGQSLRVNLPGGQSFEFKCPPGVVPGQKVNVQLPKPKAPTSTMVTIPFGADVGQVINVDLPGGKKFEFKVPAGVEGGQRVKVQLPTGPAPPPIDTITGITVKVKVPAGAKPGDKFPVNLGHGKEFEFEVAEGMTEGQEIEITIKGQGPEEAAAAAADGAK